MYFEETRLRKTLSNKSTPISKTVNLFMSICLMALCCDHWESMKPTSLIRPCPPQSTDGGRYPNILPLPNHLHDDHHVKL